MTTSTQVSIEYGAIIFRIGIWDLKNAKSFEFRKEESALLTVSLAPWGLLPIISCKCYQQFLYGLKYSRAFG